MYMQKNNRRIDSDRFSCIQSTTEKKQLNEQLTFHLFPSKRLNKSDRLTNHTQQTLLPYSNLKYSMHNIKDCHQKRKHS